MDSGLNDDKRFVIYMSDFQREWLVRSSVWLVDGTFKSCPPGFYQILAIHGFVFGKTFPFCFILMKSKEEAAYDLVFEKIKELVKMEPDRIVIDFEKALRNSLGKKFIRTKISGCHFHYAQSLYKYLKDTCKLAKEYKENVELRNIFRKILNLAFFPSAAVYMEYEMLIDELKEDENFKKLNEFIKYFEKNYMGRFENNNFIEPIYQISFWNVYERIRNDEPRTNNAVEGWHSSFNRNAGTPHPNIARFVELIKDVENSTNYMLRQLMQGKYVNITYTDVNKEFKLKIIIKNFNNYERKAFHSALNLIYKYNFQ